jgi:hypothetical protein
VGVVNGVVTMLPYILKHGEGGHIVSTSSTLGVAAAGGMIPYCTTKFAVAGMMEALATDLKDLRKRLGRIVIGANTQGQLVTAEDLKCAGAMAAVMIEAIKPTIMQTLEGTAAFMLKQSVPWIAFKILAAGAIPPGSGFKYAFENGADFVAVGMFDFEVNEDVKAIRQTLDGLQRERPWRA